MIVILFRLFSLLLFIYLYVFDFMPILLRELKRPYNPVRKVTWYILLTLVVSLITILISVVYQVMRTQGIDNEWFRNFATVTATLGGYANLYLLYLIMHYKVSLDDEDHDRDNRKDLE